MLKTPGAAGSGGGEVAALDEDPAADRGPRVELRSTPYGQRQAPAGTEHAARLGQRGGGVGHQHVPALAEHSVDGVGPELDLFGVDQSVVDVLDSQLGAPAAGDLDHAPARNRSR